MQLVEDALLAYAAYECPTAVPAFRVLSPESASQRHTFGLGRLGRWLRLPLNLLGSLGVLQFFVCRPLPLANRGSEPNGDLRSTAAGAPATCVYRFTADQVRRLHTAAKRAGVTINDLLLTDLFMTIDRWQSQHAPQQKRPCVRLSMPINLRTNRQVPQTAANVVSMIFLDRRPRWYRSRETLLRTVRRDTRFIKCLRLGLVFSAVVAFFQKVCGGNELAARQ